MGRDTPLHACFEPNDEVRRRLQDGDRAARSSTTTIPTRKRVDRRRARASKACAARTASTPPRSSSPASRSPSTCRSSASPSRARRIEDAPIVTQYEMHGVEDLGLLKMDFLGLRNLDVIEIALDLIEQSTGARPDIDDLPLDDPQDVRAAAPRRHDRRVPARGRADARAAALDGARRRSKTSSAVIALYRPGPDGAELAQRIRRPQERPQAGHVTTTPTSRRSSARPTG